MTGSRDNGGLLLTPRVIADDGGYCQQGGLLLTSNILLTMGLSLTMRVIVHVEYSDDIGGYC